MNAQATFEFAGFWDRFAAIVVDMVIITALGMAFVGGLHFFLASLGLEPGWRDETDSVFGLIIGWLYFAGMESSRLKATIGKLGIGIIVTDSEGMRIGFAQASWRYVAKLISWLVFLLGFIVAAFTPNKQGFHDMAASTLVLKKPANTGVTGFEN